MLFNLDFSKAFDIISHSILLDKLAVHDLDRFTVDCVKNWLDGQAQRVPVNGVQSSWQLSSVVFLRAQCWGQFCLTFL